MAGEWEGKRVETAQTVSVHLSSRGPELLIRVAPPTTMPSVPVREFATVRLVSVNALEALRERLADANPAPTIAPVTVLVST